MAIMKGAKGNQEDYDAVRRELATGEYKGRAVQDISESRDEAFVGLVIAYADGKEPPTTLLVFDPQVNTGPR